VVAVAADQMAVAAAVAVRINPFLVLLFLQVTQSQWQLVLAVQPAHGVVLIQGLQAEHLHYSEAQQQSHQPTAAVVAAVAPVLPSVPAVRQQPDSLVAQAAHHQPLAAPLAASARTEPLIISLELWTITAEAALAALTAVRRPHQLHLVTMQAPQAA